LVKLATLCIALACTCFAQTAKTGPEFEVASIKPAPPRPPFAVANGLVHFRADADLFDASNQTLASLISFAYGIGYSRISGPGWMSDQEFAIEAKLPTGSTKEQIPEMLQKLLADRFRLSLHRDQKEEAVFELVVDRQGLKLKPSAADESDAGCESRPGQIACRAMTLGHLAGYLSGLAKVSERMAARGLTGPVDNRLDRSVVDQTGLAGVYDFDLQWVPSDGLPAGSPGASAADGFPPRDPAAKADSIFGALEAKGLRLQPARHSFDILVIDHVERLPSEN
jgi:uncharacterized protein (TIGR03435 family)